MATPRFIIQSVRAKRANASQFGANITEMLEGTSSDMLTYLCAAAGDLLPMALARVEHQWISMPARIVIATALARYFAQRADRRDPEFVQSRMWAELMVTWKSQPGATVADMNQARAFVIGVIRSRPPSIGNLTTAFTTVLQAASRNVGLGTVAWDLARLVCPPQEPAVAVVSVQKYRFFEASAHAWNPAVIWTLSPAVITALTNLRVVNDQDVPAFEIGDIPAREQWTANWAAMTEQELLAALEMVYYSNPGASQGDVIASVIGPVIALCKNSFTDAWVESRVNRVGEAYPNANLGALITRTNLEEFSKAFVPNDMPVDIATQTLGVMYTTLSDSGLASVNWVIEQSIASNATSAIAFGTSVSDMNMRPLRFIIDKIGDGQWVAIVEVAVQLYVDPWGSLRQPYNPASMYPDLANAGSVWMKRDDRKYRAYSGKRQKGKIPDSYFIAVYDVCKQMASEAMEQEASDVSILRSLFAELQVDAAGDYVYISDNSGNMLNIANEQLFVQLAQGHAQAAAAAAAPVPPQGQNNQAGQAPAVNANANRVELHGAQAPAVTPPESREGWPNRFKNLPSNTVRLPSQALEKMIGTYYDTLPKMVHVKKLVDILAHVGEQKVLMPYGGTANNLSFKGRYNEPSADLLAVAQFWNVNVNTVVPNRPLAIDDIAYDAATMLTSENLARPVRASVVVQNPA